MPYRRAPLLWILLLATPARAADASATTPVVFALPPQEFENQKLAEALRETLSRTPGFNLMAKVTPDALVITFPGGIDREGHNDSATFSFTAVFSRNGDRIGESLESCAAAKLSDCADQLAADAQSAAGMAK